MCNSVQTYAVCEKCGAGLSAAIADSCPHCQSADVSWCFGCGIDRCNSCCRVIRPEDMEPLPQAPVRTVSISWPRTLLRLSGCLGAVCVFLCYVLCVCAALTYGHYGTAALWFGGLCGFGRIVSDLADMDE